MSEESCKKTCEVRCEHLEGHRGFHGFGATAFTDEAHEEIVARRRALTELAEAASLVVAEWDLSKGLVRQNQRWEKPSIAEDIERLRACVTTHMPVIEAAGGGT